MFTTGKHNRSVPKEPRANLAWRLKLYKDAEDKPERQAELTQMCREDFLFYVNAFGWQHNPKSQQSKIGPFVCWPEQEKAASETIDLLLNKQEDVGWEKSRYVGATWLALFLQDWGARFIHYSKFLDISHTEAAVDTSDDPDSLFWKIEFINEHLPDWLKQEQKKRKLGFKYPRSHGVITGAATTERSGVGGRATGVLLDEFSKHRTDYAIWGQTRDTGPRLVIGTHYGLGSCFFKLTRKFTPDGKGGMKNKIVLHWSIHPLHKRGLYKSGSGLLGYEIIDKSFVYPPDFKFVTSGEPFGGPCPGIRSPWYDAECLARDKRDVAMHLDIDPEGSTHQYFDAYQINTLIGEYCREPEWEGELLYDHDTGQLDRVFERVGGPLQLWVKPNGYGRVEPGQYVSGWDVAEGQGSSPSCGSIWHVESGTKVGRYVNAFLDPRELAAMAFALGYLFHGTDDSPMKIGWEVPGPGFRFGRALVDLGYRHIYLRTRTDKKTREVMEKMGWANNPEAIREAMGDYRDSLYARKCLNQSRESLEETLKFEYDPRGYPKHSGASPMLDPSAGGVSHGDDVIADMIGWMLAKPARVEQKKKDESKIETGSLAWRMKYHDNLRRQQEAVW